MAAIGNQRELQKLVDTATRALEDGEYEKLNNLLGKNRWFLELTDRHGKTLLHRAAQLGQTRCAELLLQHKGDLSVKGNDGDTPLDTAIKVRSIAIEKLFISASPKILAERLKRVDSLEKMPNELLRIVAEYGQTELPPPPIPLVLRTLMP